MPLTREMLERLTDRSTDIVVATNRRGRVVYYNDGASKSLGYDSAEILGTFVGVLYPSIDEARRVMDVLPKRLGRFGLTMHPEKSRLVRFRQPKPAWLPSHDDDDSKPRGTFDFLGFTHYWG